MFQNLGVYFCKFYMPSLHYNLGHLKSFICFVGRKTTASTPTKSGHKISWKTASKAIRTYAIHCTCIDHSIDTAFAMIARHQATKLETCSSEVFSFVVPKTHLGVIVF